MKKTLALSFVVATVAFVGCGKEEKAAAPVTPAAPAPVAAAPAAPVAPTPAAPPPAPGSAAAKPAAAAPAIGQTVTGNDEQLIKALQQVADTYQRVRAGSGESGGSSGNVIPPLDPEMTVLVKAGLLRALPPASGGRKFVYNATNGKVEIK